MKNPLSLEALRDWIKTKPAAGEYCWHDPRSCLLGQYFKSIGAAEVHSDWWRDADGNSHLFPLQFMKVALGENWHVGIPRYGAALKRAEKLIASQSAGQ